MAFHVKQEWDEQYQSESSEHLYSSSKPPRLLFEEQQHHSESAALPLFVSEPNNRMNNLSAFAADSTSTTTTSRFARGVRGFFNLAQWQELELQALIFKYMLVKAPVPLQLIDSIKKTLPDNNPAFYLHQPLQQYQYFQQGMLRSGYWGNSIDPEPGRCRRTDGKKWRCAKDVVEGQKYCERHMHRGRNRSRKPVESSSTPNGGLRTAAAQCAPYTREATTTHFALAAPAPAPAPSPLSTRYAEIKSEQELSQENRTDGEQTLRQFFDINANPESFPTGLSISIPEDQQPSSDFSLKLATGSEENNNNNKARKLVRWGSHQMGGPLAEALRQSASTSSSPTSVLLGQQARASGSDLSGVST